MNQDLIIESDRLLLYTVLPAEYELLEIDRTHPNLWIDRGFIDPNKHFLIGPDPIKHRLPRVHTTTFLELIHRTVKHQIFMMALNLRPTWRFKM